MKERCPDATLVGKAELPGYRLGFTIYSPKRKCGCADVLKDPSQSVWGLLYLLTPEDLKALDICEGTPIHYQRISASVVDGSHTTIQVETYEVVDKAEKFQKPSRDYRESSLSRAIHFCFRWHIDFF